MESPLKTKSHSSEIKKNTIKNIHIDIKRGKNELFGNF